ncbi:sugar ABC transporter substrate-binding protein [Streptomyces sp. NPDC090080]|uniref:sugar ABC transporter substrate-binding protein n=1 Tax=Streptomyces sp. NPDC090080 TaxID=3365939 RepID=UPI003804EEA3
MRRTPRLLALSAMTLSLTGCGALDGATSPQRFPERDNHITVGVLMPETTNTRFANFDYPIIKNQVADLTEQQGKVEYANADASVDRQKRQMQRMIDEHVDVILLDAVDAHAVAGLVRSAEDGHIPVVAYDRLAEGPIDAYVSFDNELVGEVQARTLLAALGADAGPSDKVVMMNGSPTDPNTAQFRQGALSELKNQVNVAASYDTEDWSPKYAAEHMAQAIKKIGGSHIAGVYSANDAMVSGIITALKKAGVTTMPPITGQDADLDALRRIVTGEQYMTVYKPYQTEAEAAAKIAIAKVQSRDIVFDSLTQDRVDSPTEKDIPSRLLTVTAVTRDNIDSTVVADDLYKVSDICTAEYETACADIGLK